MFCDRCGSAVTGVLPVEPLYTIQSAAILVPLTKTALARALHDRKALLKPPLYRWHGIKRFRYLYASDIRALRAHYFSEVRHPGQPGKDSAVSEGREASSSSQG